VTGFRGSDDSGRVADPLTPENLRPLLTGAPASVLVERTAAPTAQARATRLPAGRWTVEVRPADGPALVATVPNTDAAFDALRSWAADDDWYREAFTFAPVGAPAGPAGS
jgi:hypothetical protein